METKSKIALITGGSRGLGKNMALNLAKKGINVILTYHASKDKADAVVQEIEKMGQKAYALQLNTGDTDQFEAFFQKLNEHLKNEAGDTKFDFLINNAGTALYSTIAETTEEQFDTVMNIHFKGTYFLTQKALPHLKDGGRIVNISSGLTRVTIPGSSAYASMKGAVEVFTKYLAKELGPRKITANVVAPGAIETDFGNGHIRDDKEANKMVSNFTALGRAGLPEDIGGVVAFLCTEDAYWINGQRIEVAGGMSL